MYLTKKLLTLRLLIPKTCVFKRSPKRFLNFWVRLQVVEAQKSEKKSIHNRVLRSKFEIGGQFCMEGWNGGFGVNNSGFVSHSLSKLTSYASLIQKEWPEEHSLQLNWSKIFKTVNRTFVLKKFGKMQKYSLVPFEKEFLEILPTRPPTFSALKTSTCAWKSACKTPGTQLQEISGNEPSKIFTQYGNMTKFWK